MEVGIIDADLIGRKKHAFPNLVCMKLSSYYLNNGHNTSLLLNYEDINNYDKVYVSKVFTDTFFPEDLLNQKNIEVGGTGFYYDKAAPLPYEIEHSKPDYHLYDNWLSLQSPSKTKFKMYTDYSIGFLTRGCFRQCKFCVNQNFRKVEKASELNEFYDPERKKICLLDDNFLGYKDWENELYQLKETGKKFIFKQGLDIRLLTDKKCEVLFSCKYDGEKIFAFDNYEDANIIIKQIDLIRKYSNEQMRFYVFTGFDRKDIYDQAFWKRDLYELFERIKILMQRGCLPYVMRHTNFKNSPYASIYTNVTRWCNQVSFFKSTSWEEFATLEHEKYNSATSLKAYQLLCRELPELIGYTKEKYHKIS